MPVFWAVAALSKTKCLTWGLAENKRKSSSVGAVLPTGAVSEKKAIALPIVGPTPNGVELKAERRKPSGEKPCDIEDNPSFTGVLAHFRLH